MNAVLFDVALTAYILAALAAVGSFAGRREQLARFTLLLTQAGWVCHSLALIARGAELGRLPILTLAEVVSVVIWAAVLFELWIERRYRLPVLSAFVLPGVLALGLGLPTGLRNLALDPQVQSRWVVVHVALLLVGLAALVLNVGGALMYLLQDRQLKAKRPGAFYYRLPSLEALDRLTFVTLTVASRRGTSNRCSTRSPRTRRCSTLFAWRRASTRWFSASRRSSARSRTPSPLPSRWAPWGPCSIR